MEKKEPPLKFKLRAMDFVKYINKEWKIPINSFNEPEFSDLETRFPSCKITLADNPTAFFWFREMETEVLTNYEPKLKPMKAEQLGYSVPLTSGYMKILTTHHANQWIQAKQKEDHLNQEWSSTWKGKIQEDEFTPYEEIFEENSFTEMNREFTPDERREIRFALNEWNKLIQTDSELNSIEKEAYKVVIEEAELKVDKKGITIKSFWSGFFKRVEKLTWEIALDEKKAKRISNLARIAFSGVKFLWQLVKIKLGLPE